MVILMRMHGVNSRLEYTIARVNLHIHDQRQYNSTRAEVRVSVGYTSAMQKITQCGDTFNILLDFRIRQLFVVGLTRLSLGLRFRHMNGIGHGDVNKPSSLPKQRSIGWKSGELGV